jgi:predicted Mrr-cat superfamily restriction endonuclease
VTEETVMSEQTCWLLRAGEGSRHARRFADEDVVAVGWPDVDGLGDLTAMSDSAIRECLRRHGAIASPDQDAAELLAFRDGISVGDIVITPDAQTREVLFGEVTGGYEYRDPSPAADYKHVRQVRWYGRFERDFLPADLAAESGWRRTIRRLGHQAEWRTIALRVLAGEGRVVTARGRPEAPGSRRSPIAPGAAPTRRCLSCGLSKATAQFVPGDERCVDCR